MTENRTLKLDMRCGSSEVVASSLSVNEYSLSGFHSHSVFTNCIQIGSIDEVKNLPKVAGHTVEKIHAHGEWGLFLQSHFFPLY